MSKLRLPAFVGSVRQIPRDSTSTCPIAQLRIVLLAGLLMPTLIPGTSFATLVKPIHIRDCVHLAGLAFGGKVSKITYEDLSTTIVTHVVLTDLKVAKGAVTQKSLTLTLEGGTNGRLRVVIDGQPEFELGKRYVLLTKADLGSPKNTYAPIIGLFQGFFPVQIDSPSNLPIVTDWAKRPIAQVGTAGLMVVDVRRGDVQTYPPHQQSSPVEVVGKRNDPGTRLSEDQFLDAIKRLDSEK